MCEREYVCVCERERERTVLDADELFVQLHEVRVFLQDVHLHISDVGVRVVHFGRSTSHAISGRGDHSTVQNRRGHLLSSQGGEG